MRMRTALGFAAARMQRRPQICHLNFELTHQCNLRCVYCDRHTRDDDEMELDAILATLAEFHASGLASISLDGGEPLVHPHVEAIVDWLAEHAISVRMNSNGILVPRRQNVVAKLAKLKISLDGPREIHDRFRGERAFDRAIRGAITARDLGVKVELTCTVAQHNLAALEAVVEQAEALGVGVVFQPVRASLFVGQARDGSFFVPAPDELRAAFRRIERLKRAGRPVANRWSSLRHFRRVPEDTALPCAAGWVEITMDPSGRLYHCGQIARRRNAPQVVRLGAHAAFAALKRFDCRQCWCARQVEGNYLWGGRLHLLLPPFPA